MLRRTRAGLSCGVGLVLVAAALAPARAQRPGLPTAEEVDGVMKLCAVGRNRHWELDVEGRLRLWRQGAEATGRTSVEDLGALLDRLPEGQQINPEIYKAYTACVLDTMRQLMPGPAAMSAPVRPAEPISASLMQARQLRVGPRLTTSTRFVTTVTLTNQAGAEMDLDRIDVVFFAAAERVLERRSVARPGGVLFIPGHPLIYRLETPEAAKSAWVCVHGTLAAPARGEGGDAAGTADRLPVLASYPYSFDEAVTAENPVVLGNRVRPPGGRPQPRGAGCGDAPAEEPARAKGAGGPLR